MRFQRNLVRLGTQVSNSPSKGATEIDTVGWRLPLIATVYTGFDPGSSTVFCSLDSRLRRYIQPPWGTEVVLGTDGSRAMWSL